MIASNDEKSVYRVLAQHLHHATKCGNYVKGYIDGQEKLDIFLKDYYNHSKTRFITRSSCKKNKDYNAAESSTQSTCTRYGKEDRIYWEFNNRNLIIPFTGMPFVTKSSQVKHCQHGSQYYKLKAEKILEKQGLQQCEIGAVPGCHEDVCGIEQEKKQRRPKPTKKRNCPAYLLIREVVLFPEFAISSDTFSATKNLLRREKAETIHRLKQAMTSDNLATLHRFHLHVPLPEAHADHPEDGTCVPLRAIDPFVRSKIDELLGAGLYEVKYIQLIVHDHITETVLKNEIAGFQTEPVIYPTEQEINDYIYLSSITSQTKGQATSKDGNDNSDATALHDEMQRSVQELRNVIQSCTDDAALTKAKKEMKKVIRRVKRCSPLVDGHQWHNRKCSFPPKLKECGATGKEQRKVTNSLPAPATIAPCATVDCLSSNSVLMHQQPAHESLSSMLVPPNFNNAHDTDMMPSFTRLLETSPVMMHTVHERIACQPAPQMQRTGGQRYMN